MVKPVDEETLEMAVIDRLGRGIHPHDVVLYVCQRTGWEWQPTEAYVEEVQCTSQSGIVNLRFGLRVTLASGVILIGMALIVLIGTYLTSLVISQAGGIGFRSLSAIQILVEQAPLAIGFLPVSISMVVGGILGLLRLFSPD